MSVLSPTNCREATINAMVNRRAETLFTSQGYTYEPCDGLPGVYLVFRPDRPTDRLFAKHYTVDLTDGTCTCRFFEENHLCKHLLALQSIEGAAIEYDAMMANAESGQTGTDWPDGPLSPGGCRW